MSSGRTPNPLTDYPGGLRREHHSPASCLATTEVSVMWFVAALLAFTVAYAALRCVRPAAQPRPLRPGLLAAAALVIAVSSFVIWQPWPVTGEAFLNLRPGEWPQGAVLFALGVHAAGTGWPVGFPPVLARRRGWVAAAGVAALMTLMSYQVLARGKDQALAMGADPPTMAIALLDGVIAVSGTLAFAPVALAPEIKFVLIAAAGVAACFTAGYALTRVPGISRVL